MKTKRLCAKGNVAATKNPKPSQDSESETRANGTKQTPTRQIIMAPRQLLKSEEDVKKKLSDIAPTRWDAVKIS